MNIDTLALKIAAAIKRANSEQTNSIEVMQYALSILLNTGFIFAMTGLIGWIMGLGRECLLFLFSFSVLRVCSGGVHLKTARACNFVSILLCTSAPLLAIHMDNLSPVLTGTSLLAMILFAPNPDRNAQIPLRLYPLLKGLSILIVCVNFFLGSSVIGLAFVAQSLTVIFLKRREHA